MSIYPSLEDMKVDQMVTAQNHVASAQHQQEQREVASAIAAVAAAEGQPAPAAVPAASADPGLPYPVNPASGPMYPGLAEYMGLELTEEIIRENMPEYLAGNQVAVRSPTQLATVPQGAGSGNNAAGTMVAPLSSANPLGLKTQVGHGIRQVVLCKDGNDKVGLRVRSINKGVFVCLVTRGSPAAMGGLRFGDQVLQMNGVNVAGFSESRVHEMFKKADVNNIVLAVRDRPFERTLTLHKDSTGHLGFQFKDGKITAIAVNSSSARNGLLIEHNLLEVNGQNVVGIKDKEIHKIVEEAGQIATVTVIPNFLFQHMVKNMSGSLVRKMMDHSIPDL